MKSLQRRKPANGTTEVTRKALEELVSKAKADIEATERSLEEPLNKAREDIEVSEEAEEGSLGKANEDAMATKKALEEALRQAREAAVATKKALEEPFCKADEDAEAPRCLFRSHVGCPVSVAEAKNKALEEALGKAREESRLAREALIQAQKENALVKEDAITAIKGLEEALREANPMQSQYMSNILHKLCTPLHSIIGFSKLLLDSKVADVETQKEFLTIINQQSEHLCSLIDELTEISNIEPGRLDIRKETALIKDVIESAFTET